MEEAGNLFSKGEDWEDALIVYNQLVPVYQNIIMDYDKLAGLLVSLRKLRYSLNHNFSKKLPSCIQASVGRNVHISITTWWPSTDKDSLLI